MLFVFLRRILKACHDSNSCVIACCSEADKKQISEITILAFSQPLMFGWNTVADWSKIDRDFFFPPDGWNYTKKFHEVQPLNSSWRQQQTVDGFAPWGFRSSARHRFNKAELFQHTFSVLFWWITQETFVLQQLFKATDFCCQFKVGLHNLNGILIILK